MEGIDEQFKDPPPRLILEDHNDPVDFNTAVFSQTQTSNHVVESLRGILELGKKRTEDFGIRQIREHLEIAIKILDVLASFNITNEVSTVSSRTSIAPNLSRTSVLPAFINGIACDALPDTMSSANVMTEEQAEKIGAKIDVTKRDTFTNACGRTFQSVGEAFASVAFPGEPSKVWRMCRFAVVKKCATPLIMGDDFLRMTETLTKFRHRLQKVVGRAKKLWRVCYLDAPRRMLNCLVGGQQVMASADTGSDVDLVSLDYARKRKWQIQTLPESTGYVLLADKTVKKVEGYVDRPLQIGLASFPTRFYVLKGLMCNTLLGDPTLDRLDAFNRYASHFVETEFGDGSNICHNITWRETVDRRLEEILHGEFPTKTAAELQKSSNKWFGLKPDSKQDVKAWQAAFTRALDHIRSRDVTASSKSRKEMARLQGIELQQAQRLDRERQERYRQKKDKVIQERNKFLGVADMTA